MCDESPSYLSLQETLQLNYPNQLLAQVSIRKDLIKVMVGQLYPSILDTEIFLIRERIRNILSTPKAV